MIFKNMLNNYRTCLVILIMTLMGLFGLGTASSAETVRPSALWAHDNLVAWCVVPFDARQRDPEARAQMLRRLGFTKFSYDWRQNHIASFDAEIEALKKNGIDLIGWWFPLNASDPLALQTLETFKRHGVHPDIWVEQSDDLETIQDQQEHINKEADRIQALVEMAKPYGVTVQLYNDRGWFGLIDNQLAIIERLRERGITDVGMVYNFSHARDEAHDDAINFSMLWQKMKDHVRVVNITGTAWEGKYVYPSQGDRELAMMQVIEASGWRGSVGLLAEKGGDAEVTLARYMKGLDWLAAEIAKPGSGGMPPFPKAP